MKKLESPIFIVGLPRSGSTLWLNIFAENQNILRLGEMLFLTPWRKDFRWFIKKKIGNLSNDKRIKKMLNLIFSEQTVHGITASFWQYDIQKFNTPGFKEKLYNRIFTSDKTIGNLFKALIEEMTVSLGHDRCCVKFPVYISHISDLLQWYPNCRIIHITRDPRAIALSRTNDPGGTAQKIKRHPQYEFIIKKIMVLFVMVQYYMTSKLHNKFKHHENYSLFKFEDLLVEPEKTIKELCSFASIDFMPEMLNPQKGHEKGQKSSLTGKKQVGFDKRAATRWRKKISAFDKTVITLLMKGSMKRIGYL